MARQAAIELDCITHTHTLYNINRRVIENLFDLFRYSRTLQTDELQWLDDCNDGWILACRSMILAYSAVAVQQLRRYAIHHPPSI
jgi:hypothetical protein